MMLMRLISEYENSMQNHHTLNSFRVWVNVGLQNISTNLNQKTGIDLMMAGKNDKLSPQKRVM